MPTHTHIYIKDTAGEIVQQSKFQGVHVQQPDLDSEHFLSGSKGQQAETHLSPAVLIDRKELCILEYTVL